MLQKTLNILTNPDRRPVTAITRTVRELCLAHARSHYPGEGFTWEWSDGEPTDASARWPQLPRNLARAIIRPLTTADLAVLAREAIASLSPESATPMPLLDKMAAELAADTDLGDHVAREALRHAVVREAALRFTASAIDNRTD